LLIKLFLNYPITTPPLEIAAIARHLSLITYLPGIMLLLASKITLPKEKRRTQAAPKEIKQSPSPKAPDPKEAQYWSCPRKKQLYPEINSMS